MSNIVKINQKPIFTLEEARQLLPTVLNLTENVVELVKKKQIINKSNEEEVNKIITNWQNKLQRLGLEAKFPWFVDFDCGIGYFCWKYPEKELNYFHTYTEGYISRISIQDMNTSYIFFDEDAFNS